MELIWRAHNLKFTCSLCVNVKIVENFVGTCFNFILSRHGRILFEMIHFHCCICFVHKLDGVGNDLYNFRGPALWFNCVTTFGASASSSINYTRLIAPRRFQLVYLDAVASLTSRPIDITANFALDRETTSKLRWTVYSNLETGFASMRGVDHTLN